MGFNYTTLRESYAHLPVPQANKMLRETLNKGLLKPEEHSIQECFAECFGMGALREARFGHKSIAQVIQESDAVKASAFSNINGQVVFSAVKQRYDMEELVFSKLVPVIPTTMNGDKFPGATEIGDQAAAVPEGEEYPLAGIGDDYQETPPTVTRGMIVPITRTAILFDRTGLVLDRCRRVGEFLGVNKEKRLIDAFIDENVTAHRYRWNGTTIATYGDNSGTHSWDNLSASTALTDYTDVDAAIQLFVGMTDPHTGEPIMIVPKHLVCCPELSMRAFTVLNATSVRRGTGAAWVADQNDVPEIWTTSANPIRSPYQVVTSALLKARMATDTTWYLADVSRTVAYMQNWPLTVTQAPPNSHDEFHRDIVMQFKASERGAATVMEPRTSVKCTA